MLSLAIRTDQPTAELHLYDGAKQVAVLSWRAHRQLAETIHTKIDELLKQASKQLSDVEGVIVFSGPGSFTGLRIGASVANALSYSLQIPIVGTGGSDWLDQGLAALRSGQNNRIVKPSYGAQANVSRKKR